jgi:hypothetical protein
VRTLARLIAECSARRGDAETAGDEPLWDEAIAGLGG